MKHEFLLSVIGLLVVAGCDPGTEGESAGAASCDPAATAAAGAIVVRLEGERIFPDTVRLRAGEPVELLICNTGDHARELLIGRGRAASGFAEPFFSGVPVSEMQGGVLAAEWPARSPESPLTVGPADVIHAHPNVTFLVQPGDSASLRFVPPADNRGHWQMGSFRGPQYDRGATGVWIVE